MIQAAKISKTIKSGILLPPKNNKKPNKFLLFIKKLLSIISTKRFLFSSFIIFITGLSCRYFIIEYLDVFKEYFNIINIVGFSACISAILELIAELLDNRTVMTMNPAGDNSTPGQEKENLIPASQVSSMNMGGYNTPAAGQPSSSGGQSSSSGGNPPTGGVGNPPAGGGGNPPAGGGNPPAGGGNPPAGGVANSTGVGGNLRAGKTNGPILVDNPNNQNYQYDPNGVNQPLMGNIANSLENQFRLQSTNISRFMFSPAQEKYVLTFLLYNHRDVYDNIMDGVQSHVHKAKWYKQGNTQSFRNLLRNAR